MNEERGIQPVGAMEDLESDQSSLTERYRHRTVIGWGDCDPAQIAYTANIPKWALAAIEGWYSACFDIDWFDLNIRHGLGTPFLSLNFDFRSPITTKETLEIDVYVSHIGSTSIRHAVEGFQNDTLCFEGRTAAAFVDASRMKPVPVPENMRARVLQYQTLQGRDFAS